MKQPHKLSTLEDDQIHDHCDLIIVVGGDGSLLAAAHIAVLHSLPILGISRGRLGFLTDIQPTELTRIASVLAGEYQEEQRFLLSATTTLHGKILDENIALNDFVLSPGELAHMIEFEILVDGQLVCYQRADGIIITTPTGSTAYALSGGGPILHPHLNAIALVPMFPHTLSSRPIVVSGDSQISLIISKNNETSPHTSCDGQKRVLTPPSSQINLVKSAQPLRLIHPMNYRYFSTLREKLGWQKFPELIN